MQALIFANGRAHDGPMVRRTLAVVKEKAPLVIAADGGARVARSYGLAVQTVVGDMDSLSVAELAELEAQGVELRQHPAEKDENDLELALKLAVERGANWIRILGALGGRLDQTLANIYLLALPELRGLDVQLVSRSQAAWLLYPGEHNIAGEIDDTLSLLPLSGAVTDIHTENLYYPLRGETLSFGPARGISNVLTAPQAALRFSDGLLLIVHTLGKA